MPTKTKAKATARKRRAAPKPQPAVAPPAPKIFSSVDLTGGTPGTETEQKIAAGSKPFEGESDTERKLRDMGLTGPGH